VTERLSHQRTKGPASTPAQRLVELQNALTAAEQRAADERHRADVLQAEYDRFHRMTETSFGGVPMAQQWADLYLWEAVLNSRPQLEAIFEIGTWQGGFSWWLWGQSMARDIFFQTFDAIQPEREVPWFMRLDVFADAEFLGKRFRAFEPCVVFCDGGNKPRELRTFASELRDHRSLLLVHDWGTEMLPEDVPDTVEMVYGEFCEEIGAITRVFRLKDGGDV
jgi:hypothetical protein